MSGAKIKARGGGSSTTIFLNDIASITDSEEIKDALGPEGVEKEWVQINAIRGLAIGFKEQKLD